MKYIPSFIKIGGADSEKNGNIGQTFVVLYIGYLDPLDLFIQNKYVFGKMSLLIIELILCW